MKNNINLIKLFLFVGVLGLFCLVPTGCSDYDEPLIEDLDVDRAFAPVGLIARVRNQTVIELNWTANDAVSSYIVEFSTDPDFNEIVQVEEVTGDELPFQVPLEGETLYYIRVKSISANGLDDSTWATTSITTLAEQIFLPAEPGDVGAKQAIFRWIPNSEVTHIALEPGNITYDITASDKTSGIATVTGLMPETEYSAILYNNEKKRGTAMFTTGIDIGTGTLVTASDDLFQMIADASPGDVLVLDSGDYTGQPGTVVLDKSLTLRGLRNFDKPLLNINFELVSGAASVYLIDLDLQGDGEGSSTLQDVARYTGAGAYDTLMVSGCNIHDYSRSFIAGNETDAIVQNVIVENCVVTNVYTSGGDFIDFRNSDVLNVNVNTSTFNNCAPDRDFFRLDDAGTSTQQGLVCNVLLDQCTLYACSNSSSRRILYVRFQANEIVVTNTIITDTEGFYSNQSRTDQMPEFDNNNYFNAPRFYDTAEVIHDASGDYFTVDPGYVDPTTGDFTVTNQELLDNAVGDPRWR